MRIAILSDIHDNLWNLDAAIQHVSNADALICCGDLCSPFVIDVLAKFPGPIHIVFGNNDADLFRITRKSTPRIQMHGEFLETVLDGQKIAVNHFDTLARPIAASGLYDLLCYGHNHEFSVVRIGRTLAVNPGPIMGARFPGGKWTDTAATFVLYETETRTAEAFEVLAGGRERRIEPFKFSVSSEWPGEGAPQV